MFIFPVLVLSMGHGGVARASGGEWDFSITPYLWVPDIGGTLAFDIPEGSVGSPDVEVGPNDYLESLDFAIMLMGEARRGKWSAFTDLIYLDFSSEKNTVKSVNFAGPGLLPPGQPVEIGAGLDVAFYYAMKLRNKMITWK